MPWPPTLPANSSDNAQPQQDYHPDLHDKTANALAELVTQLSAVDTRTANMGADLADLAGTATYLAGTYVDLGTAPVPRVAVVFLRAAAVFTAGAPIGAAAIFDLYRRLDATDPFAQVGTGLTIPSQNTTGAFTVDGDATFLVPVAANEQIEFRVYGRKNTGSVVGAQAARTGLAVLALPSFA